jgi:MinD-like ATPase involved in chromosome partitioning or flagellar assembly
MDRRFAGRPYFRFFRGLSENQSIRGMRNMDEGINWVLRSPEEREVSLSFEQKLRLTGRVTGDVIFCDLSGGADPKLQLLQSMDRVIAVVDPLPSAMLEGYRTLCRLKTLDTGGCDTIYAINKMNNGVNRRQMLDFLKIKNPVLIPLVSPEHVYTAEYNCKIPYTVREVKAVLQSALETIASLLVDFP